MKKESKKSKSSGTEGIVNSKIPDSGGKIVFENPTLCSQLLRGYTDLDMLKDVRPEDIEDVTERFIPMFTEERDADVIKRVHIHGGRDIFIALIEHKSKVEYNVIMQILRYMVFIWEDYGKRKEKEHKGITKTKGFRYPPILPIVYYEGNSWDAPRRLAEKVALSDAFERYVPDFEYNLVRISKYDKQELIDKKDELSFIMLINRIRNAKEFRDLNLSEEYIEELFSGSSDDVLEAITKVTAVVLRKQNVPENEIGDIVDSIRGRKPMALFDNYKGFDVQEERRKGEIKGERKVLVSMVCAKLKKGKSAGTIAREIEKSPTFVYRVKKVAEKYAPNYDVQQIFDELYPSYKKELAK